MTGTYCVLGEPINVAGVWLRPAQPTAGTFTTADLVPIASLTGGAVEMAALVARGGATQIG